MFVKKGEKVAITANGVIDLKDVKSDEDTVFIKPKMSFGDHQTLNDAMMNLEAGDANADVAVGSLNRALMQINIVGWQGPKFTDIPLSDSAIDALDMDEDLVHVVLNEVTHRWRAQATRKSPKDQIGTSSAGTGDST